MTTNEIKPALTPDEWTKYGDPEWINDCSRMGAIAALYSGNDDVALIAWLNHALPDDDPRKITRKDVDALDEWTELIAYDGKPIILLGLVDKLRALLPPE